MSSMNSFQKKISNAIFSLSTQIKENISTITKLWTKSFPSEALLLPIMFFPTRKKLNLWSMQSEQMKITGSKSSIYPQDFYLHTKLKNNALNFFSRD